MKRSFSNRVKKVVFALVLGFLVLFVFRLLYGYTTTPSIPSISGLFMEELSSSQRNFASKRYEGKMSSNQTVQVDQKYEKIAEITTQSSQFNKEEQLARKAVKDYKALIQFEQKQGNDGNRKLQLLIGVPPENFDSLYSTLIRIGKVQAKQITKKDKTNEYKELNARRISLEQIRSSLLELKTKGGKIEEYMQLENRILEIEQQLQALGVSLGDFDAENEFCTVKFSLLEGKEQRISLLHRIKVALEWTVKIYLQLMAILFFIWMGAYFLIAIVDRIRKLKDFS